MEKQRELVHRLASLKFRPGAAEKLLPRLGRLTDQEDIAVVADAVIECATWSSQRPGYMM